jgi:PAS domain S-box-containing protein
MGSDNKPIAILNASRQVATIQHSWFDTIGQAAMLSLPFSVLLGVGLLWVLRRLTLDIRQTRDYADNILSEPGKQGRINTPIRELADLKSALLNLSKGTARQYDLLVSEGAIRASALAACQEGLLVLDESFQIIEANGAAEEVLNTPRSDMLFRPICDFMCDQWLQTSSLPADQTPMRICVVQDPTSGRCDDWIEIAMASFFAQSSRFWLCTVNDLSEEIAAERKNQRLSKELDQLNVELAVRQRALDEHAMVFTCDAQGVVLSGNQTLTDITGCPLSDLVGRTFVFTRDLEHDICLNGEIYETLSAGNTWQGDTICWNITGKMFWVAFTIVPLPTEGGKSDGFLVVGTDISAQKSLEFDLHEARLEQARTSRDIQTTLLKKCVNL